MHKIFKNTKKIHFIGIGGIGMSGMAELLHENGFKISGSDIKESERTIHLKNIGLKVSNSHNKNNIRSANLIVYSAAIDSLNPEIIEAKKQKIPIIKRAELLGELIKLKKTSIAVSGTHGKTTTASMIASILIEAKLDPTIIIGGIVNKFDNNYISGNGDLIVVEADEFDKSFLSLQPTFSVVNNMELEHLDIYKDINDLSDTFIKFINSTPFYGTVSICIDSQQIKNIIPRINKNFKTFGITNKNANVIGYNLNFDKNNTFFDVKINKKYTLNIVLNVPGLHNIYNALAAITVCLDLNIPKEKIVEGLKKYNGVKRRFEIKYKNINNRKIKIIDDYAHHPSEVSATIEAIKSGWKNRRLITVFQPHLFSRTKDFYEDFSKALNDADINFLVPIYPARETPINGVSSLLISDGLRDINHRHTYTLNDKKRIPVEINKIVKENDIILFMGAGDIYKMIEPTYKKIYENKL